MSIPVTPTEDLGLTFFYDAPSERLIVDMAVTSSQDWLTVTDMSRLVQDIKILFYNVIGADIQAPSVGDILYADQGQPILPIGVYEDQINTMLSAFIGRQTQDAALGYLSLACQLATYDVTCTLTPTEVLISTIDITNKAGQTDTINLSLPI